MVFGRRGADPAAPPAAPPRSDPPRPAGTPCGTLARALARAFREGKPEVLDLGPMCGESVVYLASRGARVHVEDFDPPPPTPARAPGEVSVDKAPVKIEHPDGRFHLVLAWEILDFVPPDRLADLGAELVRVTREGGLLFFLSQSKPAAEREPLCRYRLLADDLMVREVCDTEPARRYVHPTREIERALVGFSVQGIHLQRNQTREVLALRAGVGG